ncbi:hypothetical protein [Rhizobium leguminosarum]|uniref:hypothetical protein n=1 Tax=Rhizobium leguminosarum TaxID=384 RepID=UPI001031C422|nr:hypothetical protein [Rhizobium leguminosarum]TAU90974.1 hypothetical protein ELI41_21705 [Rhizobium leguminosarum]TAV55633.1 hypothetical protein ELI29_22445 [Rhizobium leguminosarum]
MPIELSELMDLAMRRRPHLYVGELPRPVATYLDVNPGLVYLGREEFHHIASKHTEVRQEEVQHLFLMIKHGFYFKDPNRRNCTTVFWTMPDTKKPFLVGLKAANSGEVWVQTMYRITVKKAERKMRPELSLSKDEHPLARGC